MFDDDKVTPVQSEDILKLSGGGQFRHQQLSLQTSKQHDLSFPSGDWHCAYVLLYGPRILQIDPSQPEPAPAAADVSQTTQTKTESPMES